MYRIAPFQNRVVVENKSPAGTMSTAKFGATMFDVKNMYDLTICLESQFDEIHKILLLFMYSSTSCPIPFYGFNLTLGLIFCVPF